MLVQACLRAPHEVADEAKLAIVFTYFFLLLLLLLCLLLYTHFEETPVAENLLIFVRFFCTASVQSRSLDQPLVPGVFWELSS